MTLTEIINNLVMQTIGCETSYNNLALRSFAFIGVITIFINLIKMFTVLGIPTIVKIYAFIKWYVFRLQGKII